MAAPGYIPGLSDSNALLVITAALTPNVSQDVNYHTLTIYILHQLTILSHNKLIEVTMCTPRVATGTRQQNPPEPRGAENGSAPCSPASWPPTQFVLSCRSPPLWDPCGLWGDLAEP